jgi:phosphoribosylaminoimidazolecarboxamide formyltransferase/IMP cyclohydrolase
MRALLSVYDKTGLIPFAKGLVSCGVELIASGNTAAALSEASVTHVSVAEVTGSPEMLGGRVKTLHPRIHGGILADRSVAQHMADLETNGIEPIDLVVCNLYPFTSNPSVELIDVGGPTMVRAAAKNFAHVGVVTNPQDYDVVLSELSSTGALSDATRRRLARAAFAHCATYDAAIVEWFDEGDPLPPTLHLSLERKEILRYGENPHQSGARYSQAGGVSFWDGVTQHAGTALSYLNLFDADAAWRLVHELAHDANTQAVAIIKHANPCGAAIDADLGAAFSGALSCDETSAFGGIIALSGKCDDAVAERIASGPQADVIIAPSFSQGAIETLVARRKATRLLSAPAPEPLHRSVRTFGNSALVQGADEFLSVPSSWVVATSLEPTKEQWRDLVMAWRVCGRTTSNAIAVVKDGLAVGVGAGQQSRVVAAEIAVAKAKERAHGGAGASDAFFPFPDGLQVLIDAGVKVVAQPGGSVRDKDIVAVANEAGIAMVMTGERHFRH